jgi:hypothetical protein
MMSDRETNRSGKRNNRDRWDLPMDHAEDDWECFQTEALREALQDQTRPWSAMAGSNRRLHKAAQGCVDPPISTWTIVYDR